MRNKTFEGFIIWLLIASPLWWTCGCYTVREFTYPGELGTTELSLITKGDNHYTLQRWAMDSTGGIAGSYETSTSYRNGRDESHTITLSFPRDSIGRLNVENEIEVLTKNNEKFTFKQWSPDSAGSIHGVVKWTDPSIVTSGKPHYFEGVRVIPADSIASIAVKEVNELFTGAIISGALGFIGFVVLLELNWK